MTLKQFSLAGKVAIVTGSSTGLGEGMAYGLAEAGADIVGIYNKNLPANKEKIEAMGRRFLGIPADLSSVAPVDDIINKTVETFGRLDILVNNAGIIRRNKSIDFTEEDWDDVMNVNLKTLFFLSQAAARQFIRQETGG
ncbi:MAG: SDR family NAD(P)-dependent oxidoreductase, partial [Deltaproteobacteria bacterium]|nr:SDR family NAD(P)-dependent oxidoreductase [Deltaproteobacteria bacterium]